MAEINTKKKGIMKLENVIYCGDNLTWLKKFPDKCIDLIYLDPPFFSNRNYEVIFNDGEEIRSFEDRWKGGINHYVEWMRERVFELHRVLKETGSFYLHCDWHASHYLKAMCDDIFKYKNFQNEIIWKFGTFHGYKTRFKRDFQQILFYSKSDKWLFNYEKVLDDYSEATIRRYDKIDSNGKRYKIVKGLKKYIGKGTYPSSVWDIPQLQVNSRENLGYPTQKPEALLERIIKASSNPGDLVLDPFCGCGTTTAVAQSLGRKWVGIDVSPSACKLMKNRVELNGARGIEIIGQPLNIKELKDLPPFEFQNWCVGALGGTVNPKKVADMGIDGFSFMHRYPIQVKQSENVGRVTVDKFETAMQRVEKDMGYIIGFSFTKGAYEEVAEAKKRGLFIELLTVDKLLEYEEPAGQGKMF